jgi:hypothetical protein
MYSHNHPSQMHHLNTQQHVSLEKHQQMIASNLRWQAYAQSAEPHPKFQVGVKLRTVFATLLNLFTR